MPFVSFVPSWPLFSVLCSLVCRVSYVEYCQWTVTEENACRALNIERTASPAQIRQAYLDLVKVWHPDRFEHDARLRERAVRSLQDVNEAYTVLQRAASRSRPDATPSEDRTAQASSPFQTSSHAPDHAATPPGDAPTSRPLWAVAAPYRLPILVGSLIGVGLAVALIIRTPAPAQDESTVASTGSATDIDLPSRAEPVASRARRGMARPESGTDIRPAGGTGRGTVSIRNVASADAVVRMRSEAGSQRTLYVRRGEKLTMLDVAPGDYHVEMLFGSDWLGRAFADPAGYVALTAPLRVHAAGADAAAAALVLVSSGSDVRAVAPFQLD